MRASRGRSSARWPSSPREVRRPVSTNDVQWWSLVAGLGLFVAVVVALLVARRIRERRAQASGTPVDAASAELAPSDADTTDSAAAPASRRRRPTSPPP